MQFRIANTFTDSLAKLNGDEQKAVKATAFDLQMNPANPGLSFHKLDRAKDKDFWSTRVNRDIHIIVHKTESSLLLCYVVHHDKAYQWAERRKLETHPKTGAAQIVEIRETVREIEVPVYAPKVPSAPEKQPLFSDVAEETLLSYGVPTEWLEDVRRADEDSLLELADHLPAEAAEALLELATGGQPQVCAPAPQSIDPFDHPDAQRRFRIMSDADELALALDYPWENGRSFCIQRNDHSWRKASMDRRRFPDRPVQAKQLSLCIGRCISQNISRRTHFAHYFFRNIGQYAAYQIKAINRQ